MKRRRFLIDDSTHPIFVITTIIDWLPVFSEEEIAINSLSMLESLRGAMNLIIFGYVLMPNHLHAMVRTSKRGDISDFMRKWKSKTALLIRNYAKANRPVWIYRFSTSAKEHRLTKLQTFQIWQPRFDEKAIRDEQEFLAKLNYMHGNPIKHNLVDDCGDYPYSSYADYAGGSNGYVTVQCGFQEIDAKGRAKSRSQ
jgi:REP element-mobilizing transposase RayT